MSYAIQKVTQPMREKLRAPLPAEAVKQHPTKTFLSSIKAIYVTERLNDVFGVGAWKTKLDHVTTSDKSMVVIKVTFEIPEYDIYFECYGGNDNGGENSKNFDLGDAYKGATTDALTKIGSYLEIGIDVFKGKADAPKPTNAYNRKQIESNGLPLITNNQFKQLLERVAKGDKDAVDKAKATFSFDPTQLSTLEQKQKAA